MKMLKTLRLVETEVVMLSYLHLLPQKVIVVSALVVLKAVWKSLNSVLHSKSTTLMTTVVVMQLW